MSDPQPVPFVVLRHEVPEAHRRRSGRGTHYDLMVQCGEMLRTWALAQWPIRPGETFAAEPLPPHRLAYLDYEGPISGERGHVTRVAAGECVIEGEPEENPTADAWTLRLTSPQWQGRLRIAHGWVTVVS